MAKIAQEIVTIKFTKVIASDDSPTFVSATALKTSMSGIVEGLFGTDAIVEITNTANVTLVGNSVAVTGVSGTGDIATLTFDTQADAPFLPGQSIIVTQVTPSSYNDTFTVVTCSNSTVSFVSTATGNTEFGPTVNATTVVAGTRYKIITEGTSNFTTFGSPYNDVGTIFTANATGSGTGTVQVTTTFESGVGTIAEVA